MGLIKALVFKLYSWMQGHEGVSDAHHAAYNDQKAVDACDTSNKFLERDVINMVTGETTLHKPSIGPLINLITEITTLFPVTSLFKGEIKNTVKTYNQMAGMVV